MSFDALLGNEQLKNDLTISLQTGHISHCCLITGPEGSGKHTLARLLAAHPAPWPQQPLQPLRAVFKRLDTPQELMRVAPELIAECAGLLRKGEPLPAAAAGPLWLWLNDQMGVELS